MRSNLFHLIALLAIVLLAFGLGLPIANPASASPNVLTAYYNLMGYEGVGTRGELNNPQFGPAPPIGDYVSTHCRYIDISPLNFRQYYLRYFLHLPDGSTLTQIDAFVADFATVGSMGVELRTRPWNSRDAGAFLGAAATGTGIPGDTTLTIPNLNVKIDNRTTQYWLDVYFSQQQVPGQLCVYGIQATYTFDGSFLPVVRKGG